METSDTVSFLLAIFFLVKGKKKLKYCQPKKKTAKKIKFLKVTHYHDQIWLINNFNSFKIKTVINYN